MSFLDDIRNAVLGWLDLLVGRKDVQPHFNATQEGLVNALAFFVIALFVTILFQSALLGSLLPLDQVVLSLGLNGMPLAGVALVIFVTRIALPLRTPFLTLFVPATYAMAFVILVGLPLALVTAGMFSNAMLGVLAFMFYRLGRILGPLSIGLAIAFALLSVIALVLVPVGLYMLTQPAPPAA